MSKRLKIIHICDKFGVRGSTVHGAGKLLAWWLPTFDPERFEAKLYAVKKPDTSSRSLETDGIHIDYMCQSAFSPSILPTFLKVIQQERPDVVHLHGWIAANNGRIAGRIAGVPTIMHEHGVDPNFPATQQTADRMIAPFTHTAVAVSSSVRDFLVKKRFVDPRKIRVIYNGTPLELFAIPPADVIAKTKTELGIPSSSRVIGTIGRLDTQKGIPFFLQAARRITDSCPDTRFLIIGDGPRKYEYEQQSAALGLSKNVIFTGHRSDLPAIVSMLDVQVFASLWEGLPLTLIESMATGRAIVSTNVDGLGEVLTDGEDAIVVNPRDSDKLADGVLRIFADTNLASRLGAAAKKRSQDFDNHSTVNQLESLYEELCGIDNTRRK